MWKLIYSWSGDVSQSVVYVRSFENIFKYMKFLNSVVSNDHFIDVFVIVRMDGD